MSLGYPWGGENELSFRDMVIGILVLFLMAGLVVLATIGFREEFLTPKDDDGIAEMRKAAEHYGYGGWVANEEKREFEWRWVAPEEQTRSQKESLK